MTLRIINEQPWLPHSLFVKLKIMKYERSRPSLIDLSQNIQFLYPFCTIFSHILLFCIILERFLKKIFWFQHSVRFLSFLSPHSPVNNVGCKVLLWRQKIREWTDLKQSCQCSQCHMYETQFVSIFNCIGHQLPLGHWLPLCVLSEIMKWGGDAWESCWLNPEWGEGNSLDSSRIRSGRSLPISPHSWFLQPEKEAAMLLNIYCCHMQW